MGKAQLIQGLFPDLSRCLLPVSRVIESRKPVTGDTISHMYKIFMTSLVSNRYEKQDSVCLRGDFGIHKKTPVGLFTVAQQSVNIRGSPFIYSPPCDSEKCLLS